LIFAVVFAGEAIFLLWYFPGTKSYNVARDFILSSDKVKEELGEINRVSPRIAAYQYHGPGDGATFSFSLVVHGSKNKGKVYFILVQQSDIWNVSDAVLLSDGGNEIVLKAEETHESCSEGL